MAFPQVHAVLGHLTGLKWTERLIMAVRRNSALIAALVPVQQAPHAMHHGEVEDRLNNHNAKELQPEGL